MGSKLFHSLKYTFHSIYFNTSPYTKHNLLNNLFEHTLGWVYVNIPILLPHSHFLLSKKIVLQHDSNYSTTHIISIRSKLFPSLKYTFHSIYSNTSPYTKHNLLNNLFKHNLGWVYVNIPILLIHSHFLLSKKIMLQHDSNYSTTHIISVGSKLFHSLKYTYHSIYSNTSPYTKHNLLNNLFKHNLGWVYVNMPILLPHGHFPSVQKITLQHDLNYSTTHIISVGSKLFHSLKYTFHSIYSNTSPYTKHNLLNNLFKHNLGWVYVNMPILLPHGHFLLSKKLHCNMI